MLLPLRAYAGGIMMPPVFYAADCYCHFDAALMFAFAATMPDAER